MNKGLQGSERDVGAAHRRYLRRRLRNPVFAFWYAVERIRLWRVTSRGVMLVFGGYLFGRLPDAGLAWSGMHLVIAVGFLGAFVVAIKRENR